MSGEVFTGLIDSLGEVSSVERDESGARLAVRTDLAARLSEGGSIALNGVCLTATGVSEEQFAAEAMIETLRCTTLGELRVGSKVNLELALRLGEPLGGHVVQGHVDGTATISDLRDEGFSRELVVDAVPELLRYLVLKGSITIDGVSLTVSALGERKFSVSLIPETLQRTTLGAASVGDTVNLEVDILAKHVERLLKIDT